MLTQKTYMLILVILFILLVNPCAQAVYIFGGWSGIELISIDFDENSEYPSLAVGPDGAVHIAWDDDSPPDHDYPRVDIDVFYKYNTYQWWDFYSGWTEAEEISSYSWVDSRYPSLAVGPDGAVHIAYVERAIYFADGDVICESYDPVIGYWTGDIISRDIEGHSTHPSLAVGSDGMAHIAWEQWYPPETHGDSDVYYKNYSNQWLPQDEMVSTDTTSHSRYPSLDVGPDGMVHIAWVQYPPYPGTAGRSIFYKRYNPDADEWSATEEIVKGCKEGPGLFPSLGVGPDGIVHIVWQNMSSYGNSGSDLDIFYKRYVPNPDTPSTGEWTTTEVVSTESTADSWTPSLDVGPDGAVHIAWTDYSKILYKKFDPLNEKWSDFNVISMGNDVKCENPSLAVGPDGAVHIAWQAETDYGDSGTDTDIFYVRYREPTICIIGIVGFLILIGAAFFWIYRRYRKS